MRTTPCSNPRRGHRRLLRSSEHLIEAVEKGEKLAVCCFISGENRNKLSYNNKTIRFLLATGIVAKVFHIL